MRNYISKNYNLTVNFEHNNFFVAMINELIMTSNRDSTIIYYEFFFSKNAFEKSFNSVQEIVYKIIFPDFNYLTTDITQFDLENTPKSVRVNFSEKHFKALIRKWEKKVKSPKIS